jgi:hypothetical protein
MAASSSPKCCGNGSGRTASAERTRLKNRSVVSAVHPATRRPMRRRRRRGCSGSPMELFCRGREGLGIRPAGFLQGWPRGRRIRNRREKVVAVAIREGRRAITLALRTCNSVSLTCSMMTVAFANVFGKTNRALASVVFFSVCIPPHSVAERLNDYHELGWNFNWDFPAWASEVASVFGGGLPCV